MTFWSRRKNGLIRKDKVNFKIHDVATWLSNISNTHIAQYLIKYRQPDNKTWSIIRR